MTPRIVTRQDAAEPGTRSVRRVDAYRLDKAERLPNGALRVDALVTRTGVFTYHDAKGRPVREYRPPEEVKDQASVKSLRDMTVTVLHPNALVSPENWKSVAVGHVSGEPVAQGDGIKASLVIQAKDAIDLIDAKRVQEISCGYQVTLEDSPGVTPEGEHYDSIQRNIRYNHVAMGPSGWGRQGSSVSLRLDSRGNQLPAPCCDECGRKDAHYPWDQCMSDRMGEGHSEESARKICGSIKAKNDAAVRMNAIKLGPGGVEIHRSART